MAYKMKRRRYRRRYKPRSKTRMLRTMRTYRKRLARTPEVKYATFYDSDLPHQILTSSSNLTTLWSNQNVISGLLSNIAQGTGRNQRIGNRIYVKFISINIFTRACPSLSTYSISDYVLRTIVSDYGMDRPSAGTNVNDYFSPGIKRNIHGLIDRTRFTVLHDKYHYIRSSWATDATLPNAPTGSAKVIKLRIPIGRNIEYRDGSTTVKDDKNYLGLMMLAGTPGMTTTLSNYQVACSDIIVRTYFTDAS